MNLARHADIRQSVPLNSLWGWALVAQAVHAYRVSVVRGNILFAFAVTGQALRWFSLLFWRYTFAAAMAIVRCLDTASPGGSHGMAGVAMLTVQLERRSPRTGSPSDSGAGVVGHHGVTDEPE
jgi:hypothetical protein